MQVPLDRFQRDLRMSYEGPADIGNPEQVRSASTLLLRQNPVRALPARDETQPWTRTRAETGEPSRRMRRSHARQRSEHIGGRSHAPAFGPQARHLVRRRGNRGLGCRGGARPVPLFGQAEGNARPRFVQIRSTVSESSRPDRAARCETGFGPSTTIARISICRNQGKPSTFGKHSAPTTSSL